MSILISLLKYIILQTASTYLFTFLHPVVQRKFSDVKNNFIHWIKRNLFQMKIYHYLEDGHLDSFLYS